MSNYISDGYVLEPEQVLISDSDDNDMPALISDSDDNDMPALISDSDDNDMPALIYDSDDNDENVMPALISENDIIHIPKVYTDIKYTTDGLDEKEYMVSNIKQKEKKVIRCECCYKYFLVKDYAHTTIYELKVHDIIACIHCYFSFNITKYIDNIELTLNDKKCIKYYIDNFTSHHNTENCDRMKSYNKCILCNSKKGIIPSYIMADEIVYAKNKFNNTGYVVKSNANNFTLSL
tara:strand:+ start:776 stop:1480 length:705 start_codon:yes stop_codon:yes gene_type:complete